MYLEIPSVPFAGCAMDCIGPLPASLKGHRHTLAFISLLTSYLITVPLKTKTADKVSIAYIKEFVLKTLYSKLTLQDNGTEFKNKQLMSVFNLLGIQCIYSNLYYPKGNSRVENVPNFLKHTIAKVAYGNQLEWDAALPLVTYFLT